jgi:hypothetical protein
VPQEVIYGSSPTPLPKREKGKDLVIIFPGAGGPDRYIDSLKTNIEKSDREHRVKRDVFVYDWLPWRGNFIRAAFDGTTVGENICRDIVSRESNEGPISSLHLIGISVGSFAADACAKTYKSTSEHPGFVRETYLDPFTSKGIFGAGWGIRNFGKSADVVEDYVNCDDPVPFTSDPLSRAHTFDITKSESRKAFTPDEGFSMHCWPGESCRQPRNIWCTDSHLYKTKGGNHF